MEQNAGDCQEPQAVCRTTEWIVYSHLDEKNQLSFISAGFKGASEKLERTNGQEPHNLADDRPKAL